MNKNMLKTLYRLVVVMAIVLFASFFDARKVSAIEYKYESDTKVYTYDDVDVITYEYEYKVIFDSEDDLGVEDIKDGEKSLMYEPINAGQIVKININHVHNAFLNKKTDSVRIYQYSKARNSFDSEIATFTDKETAYTLDNAGLYKLVYTYKGKIIYTNYVYVYKNFHYANIVMDEKYDTSSIYGQVSFRLILEDSSNLSSNKYYYAFGNVENNLDYTDFSNHVISSSVVHVMDKKLNVNVADKYASSVGQYFFVKIVKKVNGQDVVKVVKTKNLYKVATEIEAYAYLVDEQGNRLDEKQYYKKDSLINVLLSFNVPVTYSSLKFNLGDGVWMNAIDVNTPTDSVVISHKIISMDSYEGSFSIKSSISNQAIVKVNGSNVALNLILDNLVEYYVDNITPVVSVEDGGVGKDFRLEVDVVEEGSGVEKVLYYAKVCSLLNNGVCVDSFDEKQEKIKEANYISEGKYEVVIDEYFGFFNSVDIALYLLVMDYAGNVKEVSKTGYILDNVILDENEVESTFVNEDILDGSNIVGKKLLVKVLEKHNVISVKYTGIDGLKTCSPAGKNNGYSLYECISKRYDYNFKGNIILVDNLNNIEKYEIEFRYSSLKEEEKNIDGYDFVISGDNEYEIATQTYNIINGDDSSKIVFGSAIINEIETIFNLNKVPIDQGTLIKDLVMIEEDNVIVLQESVLDNIVFPTLLELMSSVGHLDKYKLCSLKGNKCDLNVFLRYRYSIESIAQERYVAIKFLDNTLKYDVKDKESLNNIKVDVNSKYNPLEYGFVDSFNASINKDDVVKTKSIRYEDSEGNVLDCDSIDANKLGKYYVVESYTYNNLSSYPFEYVVEVVDNEAPNIRLKKGNSVILYAGEKFDKDEFISAADNYDSQVIIKCTWDVELDVNKEGKYVASFWAEDSSGNKSQVLTMTIQVKEKESMKIYLISGGIAFTTVMFIVICTFVEIRKERRKRVYGGSKGNE